VAGKGFGQKKPSPEKEAIKLVFKRRAAQTAKNLPLCAGEDIFEVLCLMGAVVAEALEPFVLRNFPLLEGEVRLGNKIQPLESDFLDRDHLFDTQLELSLDLRRDQHRETQSLILNLVEADGLLEGEHG
jgi:hypothetical protein